jgi:hypothetical protein
MDIQALQATFLRVRFFALRPRFGCVCILGCLVVGGRFPSHYDLQLHSKFLRMETPDALWEQTDSAVIFVRPQSSGLKLGIGFTLAALPGFWKSLDSTPGLGETVSMQCCCARSGLGLPSLSRTPRACCNPTARG